MNPIYHILVGMDRMEQPVIAAFRNSMAYIHLSEQGRRDADKLLQVALGSVEQELRNDPRVASINVTLRDLPEEDFFKGGEVIIGD